MGREVRCSSGSGAVAPFLVRKIVTVLRWRLSGCVTPAEDGEA